MKRKAVIFILFSVLLSCKKGNNPNFVLDGTLTDCPANNTCTYNYFDGADFSSINQVIHGTYKVFSYSSSYNNGCGRTKEFYLKTSVSNSEFVISASQLIAGQVVIAIDDSCPCCGRAETLVPVAGGEIKGKRTDATHWLVNARIIFGSSMAAPTDSLVVNQYFVLTKLQ